LQKYLDVSPQCSDLVQYLEPVRAARPAPEGAAATKGATRGRAARKMGKKRMVAEGGRSVEEGALAEGRFGGAAAGAL
jgi:hypothetical protein